MFSNLEPSSPYIPKSRTIRIIPTAKQRRVLFDWSAAYRKTWNVSLHAVNTKAQPPTVEALRKRFVIRKHMSGASRRLMKWVVRTPKRVREYAVIDLVACYKAGATKIKKKLQTHFQLKPKTAYSSNTISISHEMVKRVDDTTISISGMLIRTTETLPDELKHNMRLSIVEGEFFLHVPRFLGDADIPQRKQPNNDDVVGIDPGLRKFATFYSPRGDCGYAGAELMDLLNDQYRISDNAKTSQRRRKVERRIRNRIDDFHWKFAHWLLSRYRTILIPRLYVARANAANKRHMKYMKHCLFVNRLCEKALEYPGSSVHVISEAYTSMQCGRCFTLNRQLGAAEVFTCKHCKLVMDRDVHSARNMILSHLG